jgi:HEAT repeat protein/beta-lactamase regulating signal transducer with metallopeptidase domain
MTDSLTKSALAWLLTYAMHSTLLLGLAWLVCKQRLLPAASRDLIWKVALAGGIVTASLQTQMRARPTGSFSLSTPSTRSVSTTLSKNAKHRDAVETDPTSDAETSLTPVSSGFDAVSSSAPRRSVESVIVLAWGVLALAFATFYLGRRLILVGRLANRHAITEGPLPAMLDELRSDVGYRATVALTSVNTISSPVALGLREICLPEAALTQLESEQQRGLLAHELAHLVRHDPIWLYIASLIERILFFQPLNRLARIELQRNAEYLCDDWAAARTGSGLPLAHCLERVAEWIETSPLGVPVAGMAEQRSLLVTRIARLIDGKRTGSPMSTIAFATAATLLLATMTAAAPGVTAGVLVIPKEPAVAAQHSSPAAQPAQDPAVIAALIERLKDTDAGVRRAAASSLGNLKSRTAVSALVDALADRNKEVRAAAAGALGDIEDPAAVPGLSRLLNDESPDVRERALGALSSFASSLTVAQVLPALRDARPGIRAKGAEILEEIGDQAAVAPLVKLLGDPSPEVRHETIQALAHLGATTATAPISAAMRDVNPEVRSAALQALRELKAPVADGELLTALHDENADVRAHALELAKEKPSAALIPVFRKLLDDSDSDVRQAAVEALSEVRDPTARAALRDALKSTDPKVRRRAAEALGDRP